METEIFELIAERLFHLEGIGAMLIGSVGALTGFLFGRYFWDRCLALWT